MSEVGNVIEKEQVGDGNVAVRVNVKTRDKIKIDLEKINDKSFGKRVSMDEYISCAVSLVGDGHRDEMVQASLTNMDRLEMEFVAYAKSHKGISKDQYIGMLMSGELN